MSLHDPAVKVTDAEQALAYLKEGNARFVANELSAKDNYADVRKTLAGGQQPYAIVLCCADSRVAPEIYFDQKLGDIFVIRNAGNVVDDIVLGSIEYGAEHLGSPLVVVLGHTSCGACTAAVQGGDVPRNIGEIMKKIAPSVEEGLSVDEVAAANAKAMAEEIKNDEIIKHLGTTVVPAVYNILSGEVEWL